LKVAVVDLDAGGVTRLDGGEAILDEGAVVDGYAGIACYVERGSESKRSAVPLYFDSYRAGQCAVLELQAAVDHVHDVAAAAVPDDTDTGKPHRFADINAYADRCVPNDDQRFRNAGSQEFELGIDDQGLRQLVDPGCKRVASA